MKRHEQWFKDTWTEPRPEPLVMTDTEILDWMNEYCEDVKCHPATVIYPTMFEVHCSPGPFYGNSIREAVSLAAAYHQEINQ